MMSYDGRPIGTRYNVCYIRPVFLLGIQYRAANCYITDVILQEVLQQAGQCLCRLLMLSIPISFAVRNIVGYGLLCLFNAILNF